MLMHHGPGEAVFDIYLYPCLLDGNPPLRSQHPVLKEKETKQKEKKQPPTHMHTQTGSHITQQRDCNIITNNFVLFYKPLKLWQLL